MDLEGLTTNQTETLKRAAHAALAREHFLPYCTYIDHSYLTPTHIQTMCAYLEALERGEITRLIITMPPRHGKSETASGKFPGWCIGRDPDRTVIMTSYAADLAEKFSEQNRDTILYNERWADVFPNVTVNPNKKRRDNWCLLGKTETCKAAGIGGGIAGFGAWLLLIDDPIKDAEQASSEAVKKKIWEWYKTTSRTRLAPGGRIVIIMTRWAEDDLVDMILKSEEASEWVVLHLPALSYGAEEDYREEGQSEEEYQMLIEGLPKTAFPDPLGRPLDSALWPERYSKEFLLTTKMVMGHSFTALYQGHPTEPEGNEFKRDWFLPITQETLNRLKVNVLHRARSYDIAWSASGSADYTVGLKATLYLVPKKLRAQLAANPDLQEFGALINLKLPPIMLVIEDIQRWRTEWDETSARIIKIAREEDTNSYKMLIEAVASQNSACKSLKKELSLWKHTIIPVVPEKDKKTRAKLALKLASLGCVFLLCPTATSYPAWARPFLNELGAFTSGGGGKDDQVDAFTQVVNKWASVIDNHLAEVRVTYLKTTFTEPRSPRPTIRDMIPEFQEVVDPFDGARDGLGWRQRQHART